MITFDENAILTPAEQRVASALATHALSSKVRVLTELATTAQMAADALGVEVGQIVKSLCFKGRESGKPLFLLVSGANRVHERRVGRLVGEKLERADADFVKQATGFSIGGVSPFGHPSPLDTWFDQDLLAYETIWAAAGNPRSVFEITPHHLLRTTGGKVIEVT
ncbi:MAG: YbaK/EbsC family protein [Hyphomicrobiaceae bacterium]|nr:YbaK/EbsC family protein [Hyphomicrobiaceae bacterium]